MLEAPLFLEAILASKVLPPEIERNLMAWAKAMNTDSATIASHAVGQGWLTPYQVQRIHAGKGQKLSIGPYILLDILGEGSMGRVFKARHNKMGRTVALKVIRKELLSNQRVVLRFQQEIRAVGQIMHPNFVLTFDADTVGSQHFVAMELIDGSDLKSLVVKHGPMPMHVACEYVRQAALGLQHVCELNMVHRDVKPSNLMVTKQGIIKVLDMGLAMLHDSEGGEFEKRIIGDGTILGTPDFLAPEQAMNSSAVDTRADIYALGGTLFYLLSGKVPYEAPTARAKIQRHAKEPPPSVLRHRPELPPQLDALIQWLMAKQPEHRFQAPVQVAIALHPFCQPPIMPAPNADATAQAGFTLPDSEAPAKVRERVTTLNPWPMRIAVMGTVAVVLLIVVMLRIK